jgi:hypothetical protein
MDKRRPWMWSSHRKTSVLILTCSILEILAVEFDQSSKMNIVEFFNTFPMSLDSFFPMSMLGVMNFWRLLSVSFVRIVGSVQNLFKVVLRNLKSRIWVGLSTKSCSLSQYHSNQYLFTFYHWVFCELWIFEVCYIAIWGQKIESHCELF